MTEKIYKKIYHSIKAELGEIYERIQGGQEDPDDVIKEYVGKIQVQDNGSSRSIGYLEMLVYFSDYVENEIYVLESSLPVRNGRLLYSEFDEEF